MNFLISIKSFSQAASWFSTALFSSSTVFKSFSGSFPPSNFFTASMNSRDLLLSKGAGFEDPEFFLTGIWELSRGFFLVAIIGLPFGLPLGLGSLDVVGEGSFRDWLKKLMILATSQNRLVKNISQWPLPPRCGWLSLPLSSSVSVDQRKVRRLIHT